MQPHIYHTSSHNEETPLTIEWLIDYHVDASGEVEVTDKSILSMHVELIPGKLFEVSTTLRDESGAKLLTAKYWPQLECVMDSILEKCGEDWWDNAELYRSDAA